MLQIVGNGRFFPRRRFVLKNGLLQLRQVVQSFLAPFGTQHFLIAAFIQNGRQHFRYLPAHAVFRKILNELYEIGGLCLFEKGILHILLQRLIEAHVPFLRLFGEEIHAAFSYVSLRLIHDAAEGHVILESNHAEIAEGVLDFHAVEKLGTAVNHIGNVRLQQCLLQVPGDVMGPVQNGHVPVFPAFIMEPFDFQGHRFGLFSAVCSGHAGHGLPLFLMGNEILSDAVLILVDEGIGGIQDFRRGAVIVIHNDGLHMREFPVEVQKIAYIGAAPGVNGLVRISHDEKVVVVAAEGLHELVLERVDVLEFINHNVLQPLLPLQPDFLIFLKNKKGELNEVIVIQGEAFLFLVQVAIENDILHGKRFVVLFIEQGQGHGNHVLVILRLPHALFHFNHVPGLVKGHVPKGESPLLINHLQHVINVRIINDKEIFWIGHRMAVLLQHRHAETVERIDVPRIVISGEAVNAPRHLPGGLIRKSDAEDMPRQDAQLIHQVGKPIRKGPGLSGPRPCNNPHIPFRRSNRFFLLIIQLIP